MSLETLRLRKEVMANQWLKESDLQDMQLAKLKVLLVYAGQKVPYHKRRFRESGFDPESLRSLADLKRIPIMTKSDLRQTPVEQLVSEGVAPDTLRRVGTSGTTGPPGIVLLDARAMKWRGACVARTAEALGYDPWDHAAALHFTYPKVDRTASPLSEKLKAWAMDRRRRYSRPYYFTYDCAEILEDLIKFKPKVIDGQPSYLRNLADAVKRSGRSLSPKLLSSSGDILDPTTKGYLESFFSCPVYDVYGSRDVGPMAWQCRERASYHMNVDNQIFELVNGDGEECAPGEVGRLLATPLENYTMPLLRYDTGDMMSFDSKPCPCGRSLPLIKNLEGRASDFITLPSGRRISPRSVVWELGTVVDIPVHQLVASEPGGFTVRFYAKASPEIAEQAIAKCNALFGNEVTVTVTVIKEEPRAKLRSVIPYVPPTGVQAAVS
jgi:phenylacetate-CoA ligase